MENYTVDGAEVRNGKLSNGSDAKEVKVLYLCDCKACSEGCNLHSRGNCERTSNIQHARNFLYDGKRYVEQKEFRADMVIDMLNVVPVKAIIETCKTMLVDERVPDEYKHALAAAFADIHVKAEAERQPL